MSQTTPSRPENSAPSSSTTASDIDLVGALKSLKEMLDRGVILPEEYAFKKAEWLRKYGPLPKAGSSDDR